MNNDYFETLFAVRLEIARRLERAKAVPTDLDHYTNAHKSFRDGVPYSKVIQEPCELASLRGKPTRKWAQAIVARTCSGGYELTFYIS